MVEYEPIGEIRSPYETEAPFQPIPNDDEFAVELDLAYAPGLADLDSFTYAYVLYDLHRSDDYALSVEPPWSEGRSIGLFATRAPRRPNSIGLSIVRIQAVEDSTISISAIDAFDGTPVLDVKPYVDGLDTREDANLGWIDPENADDRDHLERHIKGVPH
ncbi:MAG: tRNA (N6-threonylcarbamoyladenosine(37)-N6)-methyltransferase TrmO [Halorhabdus sp.]